MPLGYLAALVADMPGWVDLIVNRDGFDIAAKENDGLKPQLANSTADLNSSLELGMEKARAALRGVDDQHLMGAGSSS